MKDYLFWAVISLTVLGLTGWNLLENQRLRQARNTPEAAPAYESLDVRAYELAQSGKTIRWPASMEVLGAVPGQPTQEDYRGYGLVLALDDLSCDVCRDEQTQFALSLARDMNEPLLRIVVSSSKKMYARSYMRLNGVDVPVYYDGERAFITQNQVGKTPILMFHNPQGEVIAAHFPIPNQPQLSLPFHQFCRNFLGLEDSHNEEEHFQADTEALLLERGNG